MQPLAYLLNVNAPHESPRWEQVGDEYRDSDDVVPVVAFSDYEAQEKRINEQDLLIKILMSAAGLLGSAEQAKKIAELEEHATKLGAGSRQHLYKAFARRYREILSLRRENETQRKLIEALETLCTHDYESKDDFILRVKEKLKNGDSK